MFDPVCMNFIRKKNFIFSFALKSDNKRNNSNIKRLIYLAPSCFNNDYFKLW